MESVIKEGDCFKTFSDIERVLDEYMQSNYVQLYKRNSRTIEGYKKHFPSKALIQIPQELRYGEIDFCCIHGGKKFSSKATERTNQSTFKMDCKAGIKFRLTADGSALKVAIQASKHPSRAHTSCEQGIIPASSKTKTSGHRREGRSYKDAVC